MIFLLLLLSGFTVSQDVDYTKFGENYIYSNYINTAGRLYNDVFNGRNYQKLHSPIYALMPDNLTEAPIGRFNVDVMMWYLRIFELDAQSQVLSVCLEAILTWKDIRLAWDPSEYGGIDTMWANVDAVWQPENEIGDAKELKLIHPDQQRVVQIYANGTVSMPNVYYAEISCKVDVSDFPFDKQSCAIQFMGNGEWDVKNVSIEMNSYGVGAERMDLLTFVIAMNRVPNFYIYVIALPCFILTLLSIVGMFWTPNCLEEQLAKLSIGLTSLVSMTVLLDMVSQAIPKTSTFPLLGLYVVICVGLTALASVVVVAFCQARSEMEKSAKICDTPIDTYLARLTEFGRRKRHVIFQILFQIVNFVSFIVLLSFWKTE